MFNVFTRKLQLLKDYRGMQYLSFLVHDTIEHDTMHLYNVS